MPSNSSSVAPEKPAYLTLSFPVSPEKPVHLTLSLLAVGLLLQFLLVSLLFGYALFSLGDYLKPATACS